MPIQITMGSVDSCTMGMAPTPHVVLPITQLLNKTPAANISSSKPFAEITPKVMCKSPLNPAVLANMLKPPFVPIGPCLPQPLGVWLPLPLKVLIKNMPALNNTSKLICAYCGIISPVMPGPGMAQE